MTIRPDRCQNCKNPASGSALKYCRKCQRYVCTRNCWLVDYCMSCFLDNKRERIGPPPAS
jgi:hypothetical protein